MTDYQKALNYALNILGNEGNHAKSRIAEVAKFAIQSVAMFATKEKPVEIDETMLVRELEGLVAWSVGREFFIDSDEDHLKWLPGKRGTIDWKFWKRYRRYLTEKKKPLPPVIVDSIDELTDTVLERLEDPGRNAPWDRRGMIVGHVQSGK